VVRPDWTHLGGPFGGRVEQVRYRGSHTDYLLSTGGPSVEVRRPGPPAARRGEAVTWGLDRVWLTADQPSTAAGPG
jgi:iron(III) transport system ATP-binding protein/putative spermidine/putrescine transport system ATP-binding protein